MRFERAGGLLVAAGLTVWSLSAPGIQAPEARQSIWKVRYPGLFAADGHTHDLVPWDGEAPRQAGAERARAAGLDGAVLSFPLGRTTPENLVRRLREDGESVMAYASRTATDVVLTDRFTPPGTGASGGPLQILPSLEYFDGLFAGGLAALDDFKAAGIVSLVLIDNAADGLSEGVGAGLRLSGFGRRVVGRMNALGLAVDISHLPEPLQRDVIRTSVRPVIASHSNVRGVAAAGRNLSDVVLLELASRGGLALMTFDREYLFGEKAASSGPGLPQLLQHIDYAVRLCGVEHVGLGTDYGGSGRNAPADLSGVECLQAVADGLVRNGYSGDSVGRIMGGNIVAFFANR